MIQQQVQDNKEQSTVNSKMEKDESNDQKYRNFNYKQILTITTHYQCSSFTYNKNSTLLFVGQNNGRIRVYGFNNKGKIIYSLSQTYLPIICLIWMQKTQELISGSYDQCIIIWKLDKGNQLTQFQKLKTNNDQLHCMTLNDDENLLVLVFMDCQIQFWKKEQQTWICLQILQTQVFVYSLNFSNLCKKLIIFGQLNKEFFIEVIEFENTTGWRSTQTIKLDDDSESLCVIKDNLFAYQSCHKDVLEIYHYYPIEKKILKTQQIQIKTQINGGNGLPYAYSSQYVGLKNILIMKHGNHANFFEIDKSGNCFLQQQIEFGQRLGFYFQFKLSQDGQYLITWNDEPQYMYRSATNTHKLWKSQVGKILYQMD